MAVPSQSRRLSSTEAMAARWKIPSMPLAAAATAARSVDVADDSSACGGGVFAASAGEIVENPHPVPALHQGIGQMGADEAAAASNEIMCHGSANLHRVRSLAMVTGGRQ